MERLLPYAEKAGALLKARGETVAVAESSAGGLISAALLAVPGASAYFAGGAVIYTRKAMLQRLLAGMAHRKLHRLEGEAACGKRIAQPVLVMDGERLGRLAHDLRRAATEVEDPPPCRGRVLMATFATAEYGERAQGFGTRRQVRASHFRRPRKRGARLREQPAALI